MLCFFFFFLQKIAVLKRPKDIQGNISYMLDVDLTITNGKLVIEIVHDPKLFDNFTTGKYPPPLDNISFLFLFHTGSDEFKIRPYLITYCGDLSV